MTSIPEYVVVGHVTKDLYNGGHKIGGTATYSALTAHRLGYRAGIVTSHGPDIDLSVLPREIPVVSVPCEHSTTFENLYQDGHRKQHIWSRAHVLNESHVPEAWAQSEIVHLGPLAQEVAPSIAEHLGDGILGLTPQGWMRRWDDQGAVHPTPWQPSNELLARADAVILSLEDIGSDLARLETYVSRTRLLVLTTGWQGATVYLNGEARSFPSPPVQEVDPTGAGDVFAAVYLIALHRSGDPWLSAQFANCVASCSVQRSGLDSIPTRAEVESSCRRFGVSLDRSAP